jgi:Fur family ferric uptake transcriptional regulator
MKEELRILREHLKRTGLKRTSQREVILGIFLGLPDYLSVDEIGRAVQEQDRRVGLSTVYRSLKLFVEAGLAREHHFLAGKTRFEKAAGPGQAPRNYLICTECHKVQVFADPLIDAVRDKVCKGLKFAPKFNRLEIYGLCSDHRGPVEEDED